MKTVLVSLIILALLALGAYFGFQYLKKSSTSYPKNINQNLTVTKTGTLTKVTNGTDYTHLLNTGTESVKINSYTVKLLDFENQKVTVTGEYSGTTLFVDTIN